MKKKPVQEEVPELISGVGEETITDLGLLTSDGLRSGVQYVYGPDGFIDWYEMIDKNDIVVFKENFERKKKPIPSSIEGLDRKDCLVLLAGFKKLARLRGIERVSFRTNYCDSHFVSTVCSILWTPNYETLNKEVEFEGMGDASVTNCDSFTKYYLTSISENRAFVRAVRGFLNISAYGKDEIGVTPEDAGATAKTQSTSPHILLTEKLQEKGKTFQELKDWAAKKGTAGVENWKNIDSIPANIVLSLLGKFSKE